MNKTDIRDLADAITYDIGFIRALMEAAKEKAHFYLSNQALLGPYCDILTHHAQETEDLLVLALDLLEKTGRGMEGITDFLYESEPAGQEVMT